MITEIEKAIKLLTKRIDSNIDPTDALKITQAALNLMHVKVNENDLSTRDKLNNS